VGRTVRYVFTDPNQPPFRDDIPYPDPLTEQHKMGAFWAAQWSQQFAMDASELRLIVEGEEEGDPCVTVELDFHSDWTAIHRLVREKGSWVAAPEITFRPRHDSVVGAAPKARDQRRANLDRHRPRIDELLRAAMELEDVFRENSLYDLIVYEWGIEAPRSRRGRKPEVDPDEVDRLLSEGLSASEVAARLGVHPKTPFNTLNKSRKRKI
jgi:hypothetical protein